MSEPRGALSTRPPAEHPVSRPAVPTGAGAGIPAGGSIPAGAGGRRRLIRLAVVAGPVLVAVAVAAVALSGGDHGTATRPAAGPPAHAAGPAGGSAEHAGSAGGASAGDTSAGDTGSHTDHAATGGTASGTPGATGAPAAGSPAGNNTHGFQLNVPLPRARFVLTDTTGARYDFGSRTQGRATLLYFGYTNCPDQCPTTLADIAAALRHLPADVRSKVLVVFVTTDPARDTPAVMGRYLAQFDPTFVGLTGTTAEVVRAQQAAQIPVSKPTVEKTKSPAGSTAHGGGALAYGLDDYAHLTYPAGTSVDDLTRDLPRLVAGSNGH
jgi:protein SCO1/2